VKYIIFHGMLGWGIPTAILFTLITTYMDHKSLILNQELFKLLLISTVTFLVFGILFGLWTWHWMERLYNKNNKQI